MGKSELILQGIRNAPSRTLYYECRQTTAENNVKNISEVIAEAFGMPPLAFADIEDALRFVFERAESEKVVLAIDEYPYLRDAVPGMDSILQVLLDTYRTRSHLSLILCGSFVEVMKSLLDEDNPLYGRIDMKINLQPMDYFDAARFFLRTHPRTRFASIACSAAFPLTIGLWTPKRRCVRISCTCSSSRMPAWRTRFPRIF